MLQRPWTWLLCHLSIRQTVTICWNHEIFSSCQCLWGWFRNVETWVNNTVILSIQFYYVNSAVTGFSSQQPCNILWYVYSCTIERHGWSVGALVQGRGFDSLSEGLKAVFFAAACSWFGLKKYMSQNLNVTLPYFPCKLTKCKCQMFTSIKGLKECWMFLLLAIENYWWLTFCY